MFPPSGFFNLDLLEKIRGVKTAAMSQRVISIALMVALFSGLFPPIVAGSLAREAVSRVHEKAIALAGKPQQDRGMPPHPPTPQRQQNQAPQTNAERQARVDRIQLSMDGEQSIASGQRFAIGGVPLDKDGQAIQGLRVEWSTSDRQIVFVSRDGQAIAGKPGTARLIASAAGKQASVIINVFDDGPARKKRVANASTARKKPVVRLAKRVFSHASLPEQPDDRLPDSETSTLYQPTNKVGKPEGKTEAAAATPAAATGGIETPGSANFTFNVGIAGIPGRQLDANLGLTYNSRMWHKVVDESTIKMYYDVDYGWPAPGFRLGYGQIEYQGAEGFTLTEPDGTRRQMNSIGSNQYRATDGSLITYNGSQYGGTLTYPDGTHISYGSISGPRIYPTRVTDRQGNYIDIYYVNGAGPKISMIVDTLGRYIQFYYSGTDLIAITAPGYNNGFSRQVARFYYENVSLFYDTIGLFSGYTVQRISPDSVRVLRYVYFPDTQNGYRFDYSAYGMIFKTNQLREMTVSSNSLTEAGAVTSDGGIAASSEYNYPVTPQSMTEVPKYTARTDDWAGRTTASAPVWSFTADASTGISTVTSPYPDSTVTETQSELGSGQVQSVTVKYQGTVLSKIAYFWDATSVGPRLAKIETTNDANQTRATSFSYDPLTIFNNVTEVGERDFASPGTLGTELRRTVTTYENSTNYTNRGLIHLPKTIAVFAGGSSTASSYVSYTYDGGTLTDRPGIIMHDPTYNPNSEPQEVCDWVWNGYYDEWVCNYYPVYNPATAYRGNVTSVTSYADAANQTGAETNTFSYDIAGNLTEETVNCCRRKTFSYSSSYYFAYATSGTRGDSGQLSTSTAFDFNTGLVTTTTDENTQTSSIYYYSDSLRPSEIDYADGGQRIFHYHDGLLADAAGRFHSYADTAIKLDASRTVYSYSYFDGRGAVTQTFNSYTAANGWSTQDIEYDEIGRPYRSSNPYYCSGYGACTINPEGFWTTHAFDKLGRVAQVTMPRGDDNNALTTSVQTAYAGTVTTGTDQAGKQRRQITDALGRVVRLDEPDASGNLGDVASPAQPTSYEYDTLGNLIHITQGAQHRYFKYDSLSQLTYERQVEQDAPHYAADALTGNNYWSRKIVYNSNGLVQDAYDARQMRTQFLYDGLNRVKEIHYFGANGLPDPATEDSYYWYDSQALPPGAPVYDRGYSAGRLVAMTYGGATSITGNYFGYDQVGRVLRQRQVTGSATYALSYAYNLGGLLTSETYPSNRVMSYSYDEGARLSQVSDGTTIFANGFTYAPQGGLSTETLGNGMVHSLTYNRRLQPNEMKLRQSAAGAELQRYNYAYGQVNQSDGSVDTSRNNGQIARIDGYIGGAKQWDQRMSYDSLARLSTAAEYRGDNAQQSWQTQYTFDRFGNRFQSGSANTGINYIPVVTNDIDAANNRFINTGATPTTYDPAGNILTDTKFRSLKYDYDANGRQTVAKLLDNTNLQNSIYDCAGQRVQTVAGSITRTMVYDIFGQDVADYTGSSGATLERENIYRGGQLLATETPVTTAPTGLAATPSTSNVSLSWTAAPGASNYRIERKAAGGSYTYVGATANTSFTDNGVTSGNGYLYQVCAANGQNNCTTNYTNVALGTAITFATDPTITSIADDPSGVNVTTMKAAHITELRTAVNAVRSLAGLSAATWTHPTLTPQVTEISKDDIVDLRVKLDEALSALSIQTSAYTDATLAGTPNGTLIKAAHIRELRTRVTSGSSGGGGSSSGGLQYVLSDLQGSARAVMNNGTYGSSTVIARHDYLPFGEEIGYGTGLRTQSQGYGATNTNRFKYGLTERDNATGLDHTWWRKYESTAGRWTSPDPLGGGNAYSYAGNDPVNFIDPSGLRQCEPGNYSAECDSSGFGGWGGGSRAGNGWGSDPRTGRDIIREREYLTDPGRKEGMWVENYPFRSMFFGYESWGGFIQDMKAWKEINNCQRFASRVQDLADSAHNLTQFLDTMATTFLKMLSGHPTNSSPSEIRAAEGAGLTGEANTFTDNSGIRSNFIGNENAQIRHFVASFIAASYPLGRWNMLGRDLASNPEARADRAVTDIAARLFDRNAGHIGVIRKYLANDIRREFCQ